MNLKTSITCLSILLISFSVNAQRVSNEAVTITYRGLPEQPFPIDFNTYSASVSQVFMNQEIHFSFTNKKVRPKAGFLTLMRPLKLDLRGGPLLPWIIRLHLH